jgi:hypothetical protein
LLLAKRGYVSTSYRSSGGISLKYFKNNASNILFPKLTFSFFNKLPALSLLEV